MYIWYIVMTLEQIRRPIHERFYFTDGQFRALEFDSAATAEEVTHITLLYSYNY